MKLKELPVGISHFPEIITKNGLYVDKTQYIYRLISSLKKSYFLARPRRFGKSLLISTLEEIFKGNKALFTDTWIGKESEYEWKTYPIIRLDFSTLITTDPTNFSLVLCDTLDRIAKNNGIESSKQPLAAQKLQLLVSKLAETGPIVILIDEYDAPMLAHIEDYKAANAIKTELAAVFTMLKALTPHIHFAFYTGVSKFARASIFSGDNATVDISFEPQYAALCGYTEEEITRYLRPHLEDFARTKNCLPSTVHHDLQHWYNGYRFSTESECKVYNPFSVLHALDSQSFRNYWFSSGTPSFLVKILKNKLYDANEPFTVNFNDPSKLIVDIDYLITPSDYFISGKFQFKSLLFQTGYLTIKHHDAGSTDCFLGLPNKEVAKALNIYLLQNLYNIQESLLSNALKTLRDGLNEQDIAKIHMAFTDAIANVPHYIHIEREAYYHSLLQMFGSALPADIQSEIPTSNGRIDIVMKTSHAVYVVELKLNHSAPEALAQIRDRRYYEKYLASAKTIHLIGLGFDYDSKLLTCAHEVI